MRMLLLLALLSPAWAADQCSFCTAARPGGVGMGAGGGKAWVWGDAKMR